MTPPIDPRRLSILLAMAAGIVQRDRGHSVALVEEYRAMAKALERLADGVPLARIHCTPPHPQETHR